VARQLPDLLGEEKARGGIVIAHLGNGASMCALRDGQSRDTSMGFTAVDGLMMGTRTGSLDPGVILHLVEQKGMDAKALSNLLYKQSGLLGVSGISQDMRVLLESDEDSAKEAVELFCYRAACMIGQLSMAAGRPRGAGVHRRHRRARRAECAPASPNGWPGPAEPLPCRQPAPRHPHPYQGQQDRSPRRADQRGMDDRPPRGESARPRLNSATRLETQRTRGNWTRLPSKAAPDTASPR
jgi:hypothetical protein